MEPRAINITGRTQETQPLDIDVESSLNKTATVSTLSNRHKVADTQSIDLLVEQSLAKTMAIADNKNMPKVANTQALSIPVKESLCKKQDKACFLNGGVTKTAEVRLGGDNIIYSDVKLSQDNAIIVKEDGLYVRPENWTAVVDENIQLNIDNTAQTITAEINNSPRLNNKYEYELIVNAASDYVNGGPIHNALDAKVDKIVGKALSECDFSLDHKTKLEAIDNSQYISLLRYDSANQKLLFNTDSSAHELPMLGLLTNVQYSADTGRLTFLVSNGEPINIDLPKDNFVTNGVYDAINKEIVLTLSNGAVVKIPARDMLPVIKGSNGRAINITVNSDYSIAAEYNVSGNAGNAISVVEDGVFVPAVDRTTLGVDRVDNTSDAEKPLSSSQKSYIDESIDTLSSQCNSNYVQKESQGDVQIKSINGRITFFVGGMAQMEISSEGVNFLV